MFFLSSDYDATLYVNSQISEEDIEAIKKFQEAGNKFAINTGRHLDSVYYECDKYGLSPDYHIGNNGNIITDKDRKVIYVSEFSNNLALEIVDYFESHLSDHVYFISANNGFSFGRRIFNEGSGFLEEHMDKIEPYLRKPINTMFAQVMIKDHTKEIADQLNEYFGERATFFNNDPYIDIVEHLNDKATAIDFLVDNYDIDKDSVYTIGDNFNDVTMIASFNGYAVDEASDYVKSYAKGTIKGVADLIDLILGSDD